MHASHRLPVILSCAVLAVALAGTPLGSQAAPPPDRPEIAARVRVFNDLVVKGFSDAAVEFAAIGYLPREAVQMGPDGVRPIAAGMIGRIEALHPWKPWGRHTPKATPDNRAVTENPALLRGYVHTYNKFINAGDDYAAVVMARRYFPRWLYAASVDDFERPRAVDKLDVQERKDGRGYDVTLIFSPRRDPLKIGYNPGPIVPEEDVEVHLTPEEKAKKRQLEALGAPFSELEPDSAEGTG